MPDPVDLQLKEWRKERPDLNTSGLAIVNRIWMLGKLIRRRTRKALKPLKLEMWEFEVLAALRRQGAPFELPPSVIAKMSMLTTGAMTNRIDRLEERDLVKRKPDPEDRRALYISLTQKGVDLTDRAIEVRAEEAANIVSCLEEPERVELGHLLRTLVLESKG
jgi:DNA-binding MarR family transcriptional regulator